MSNSATSPSAAGGTGRWPWTVWRRLGWSLLLAAVLTVAGGGGFYLYIESAGNFHTVVAGKVYRSRQLSGPELDAFIHRYGIHAILNLRGSNPGRSWYDTEVAVSNTDHVAHYDYGISATREVTPDQIGAILAIIKSAPKPILVHCMGGADRAGLVSAVYLLSRGAGLSRAASQLSLRYGHFPYLGSDTAAMDRSLRVYARTLGVTAQ